MAEQVDRKVQEVRVAEYRYRHEAELAAGFLEDAGIPYRLQIDDAGGADLGLGMLRPAVLWVRSVDADAARDLVALEEDDGSDLEPETPASQVPAEPAMARSDSRLSLLERVVCAGLALTFLAVAPNLPPMPLRDVAVGACALLGVVLVAVALIGRAPARLAGLIQMLSGSPPR